VSRLPITITARARADLNDIHEWYDAIRPEFSARFRDEIDVVMDAIEARPLSFPEVEKGVRRALCGTFPYKVYFVVRPDGLRVQAVYHVSRDPRQWHHR
jgi:plasmid stabilization system protein ParE